MSRNWFDAECANCAAEFRVLIGESITCPKCGHTKNVQPVTDKPPASTVEQTQAKK